MGDHQVYLLVLNCRLSPRRKTERDVPKTAGTGGRRRRMSLRWKAKTGGPSVLMPFHLGDIRRRKTETEVAETGGAFVFVCLLH